MIDYHCHILPGTDDGAADLDEAVAMARILAAAGFREVHCTPHCLKGVYETPREVVRERVAALQRAIDAADVPLFLRPGMEHYLDEFLLDYLPDTLPPDVSPLILVEAPFQASQHFLPDLLSRIIRRGFIPLIAHPERCDVFAEIPGERKKSWNPFKGSIFRHDHSETRTQNPELRGASLIRTLSDMGCLFQGNIGSFAGVYGKQVKQRALVFLREGVYGCIGSDAHSASHLAAYLSSGIDEIGQVAGEEEAACLLAGILSPSRRRPV